jgi:hypothetical protein
MYEGLDFPVLQVPYCIFLDYTPLQSGVLVPLFRRDILPQSSPVLYLWRSSVFLGNFTPKTRLFGVIKWKVTVISRFISLFPELHIVTGSCMPSGAIELVRPAGRTDGRLIWLFYRATKKRLFIPADPALYWFLGISATKSDGACFPGDVCVVF